MWGGISSHLLSSFFFLTSFSFFGDFQCALQFLPPPQCLLSLSLIHDHCHTAFKFEWKVEAWPLPPHCSMASMNVSNPFKSKRKGLPPLLLENFQRLLISAFRNFLLPTTCSLTRSWVESWISTNGNCKSVSRHWVESVLDIFFFFLWQSIRNNLLMAWNYKKGEKPPSRGVT